MKVNAADNKQRDKDMSVIRVNIDQENNEYIYIIIVCMFSTLLFKNIIIF